MKRTLKLECTRKIAWDRSVLKFLTFWSWSKVYLVKVFSLTFFFFFFFQAVRIRVEPGRIWTKGSADDVIGDVRPAEARVRYGAWPRVARAKEAPARVSA